MKIENSRIRKNSSLGVGYFYLNKVKKLVDKIVKIYFIFYQQFV